MYKTSWQGKYYGILQWFWSEYWQEVLDGNLSDDFAILQEFRSEFIFSINAFRMKEKGKVISKLEQNCNFHDGC